MSIVVCPFCGPRELHEFHFQKTVAAPGATPLEKTYLRMNRLHESLEHWQHLYGCRSWLLVRRDPSTERVIDVQLLASTLR